MSFRKTSALVTLPPATAPLSRDEEDVLVAEMQSLVLSHEVRDAARSRCITSLIRLVGWTARRGACFERDKDDMVAHLLLYLQIAVDDFNPRKGVRLNTYVARCLKFQAIDYTKRFELLVHIPKYLIAYTEKDIDNIPMTKKRRSYVLQARAMMRAQTGQEGDGENEFRLDEIIVGPGSTTEDAERNELVGLVRSRLSTLPDREADIVTAYFGIDRPRENIEEIAARLQITKSWTSMLMDRGLGRLRECLASAV